mgnify:CR=1 FL=1
MTPKVKSILLFVGVFALGGVAGAAGMRAHVLRDVRAVMDRPPPEARARFRMDAMRRQLDLTDEQVTQVQAILDEAEKARDERAEPCRAGLDELRAKTDARIQSILTPEQQARFAEFLERRRRFRKGPPP